MARRARGMTVLSYLISLTALCIALGYVDAVATFYVRGMLRVSQEGGGFAQAVTEAMPPRIIALEQTRQASILLVLVAVAVVEQLRNKLESDAQNRLRVGISFLPAAACNYFAVSTPMVSFIRLR